MFPRSSILASPRMRAGRFRSCTCHIVPAEVLRRLADDASLTADQRKSFADTSKVDAELRKLRAQASQVSRAVSSIAPATLVTVAPAPAITVYDCNHAQTLPGAPVADPATAADATARQVYAETNSVAAFCAQVFGRNSIDGAGMTMQSSIHHGTADNNAFLNGTQMTYGDSDGAIFVDFSKGNDVIGHELTHGVTQHSLQLNSKNEAGGLSERLSDCFGSMFRRGNSWDRVGQVWYRTLTGYGPSPNMKMKSFANRTRTAAAQLYPGDSKFAGAIDAGWKAVGL